MKLAQCIPPLLLFARAILAAGPPLTDYFPPDTKVAFGVRVHNIVASSLARGFAAQAQAAGANWLKLVSQAGFDPLRDLDEVLIASSGEGPNPPAVIVLSGTFDVARLAEGAQRYHNVPLLGSGEGSGKDSGAVMALLDASTIVAGDAALVRAAIDRREGGPKMDVALAGRIAAARQHYDVWGLGEHPDGFVSPMPETKGLESIDRFQFGMLLSSGLELGAELHARSPQEAEKLNASLQLVAAMLKAQQPSESAARFDIEAQEGTLKLTVTIPEEELKLAIEAESASLSQEPASAHGAAAPAAALPPPAASLAVPSVAPTAPPTRPAMAARPPGPPLPSPKAAPRTIAPQVLDKDGNTVVFTLPGKK
jgi:hypothetical protein